MTSTPVTDRDVVGSAQPVVDRLVHIAPAYFAPGRGNCILATRVGLEVLRYFGIPARALPCEVAAYNAAAVRWREEHDGGGPPPEGATIVVVSMAPRPHGRRRSADTWDGHMVLVLEHEDTMVDLDLRQFRERGRLALPDAASFAWGPGHAERAYPIPDGGLIFYRPRPDDRTHRHGDWSAGRLTRAARPLIGAIIREVRRARA